MRVTTKQKLSCGTCAMLPALDTGLEEKMRNDGKLQLFIKAVNFCGQGKLEKCSGQAHAHLLYYKRDQAQGDTRLTVFVLPHETHQCYSSIYGKKSVTFQENGKSFLVVDVDKY